MGAIRRVGSVVLAVGVLGVMTAPAADATSPPCRMTPREFRNVRVGTDQKQGMTRAFVKQMIGCGGKVTMYETFGGGFSLREVEYKRTSPVGSIAHITYLNDRVMGKGWYSDGAGGGPVPVPPPPTVVPG